MARSDFWFTFPFRVRYSECDPQGIVFNAHYLTYFDTAITEYFRALPYDYMGQVKTTGTDFHTVRSVVDYKAPIPFDAEIEVAVRTQRLGNSSLTLALEIHDAGAAGDDDPYATGEVVWVNTDQQSHRSAPLPQALIDLLGQREDVGR